MALKDFIFTQFYRGITESCIFDTDGNKIFQFPAKSPYGFTDYDHFMKVLADESFVVGDRAGNIKHYALDGTVTKEFFGTDSAIGAQTYAFDSAKNSYWYTTTTNGDGSYAGRVWKRAYSTGAVTILADLSGETYTLVSADGDTFDTATIDGVEYMVFVVDTAGTKSLKRINLSTQAVTDITPPSATGTDAGVCVTDGYVLYVDQTGYYSTPLTSVTWSTLTQPVEIVGVSLASTHFQVGYLSIGDVVIGKAAGMVVRVNLGTGVVTSVAEPVPPLTFGAFTYNTVGMTYIAPLSDGTFIAQSTTDITKTNTDTYSVTHFVQVADNGASILSDIVTGDYENFETRGPITFRANHCRITGQVTGTGSAGASVSLLSNSGDAVNTVLTDGSGNYSIDCFGTAPRKVLVVSTTGASQVHDSVVPVSVA